MADANILFENVVREFWNSPDLFGAVFLIPFDLSFTITYYRLNSSKFTVNESA